MRVNLLGGTYLSRSLIANAQTCLNLYPEKNPQDASAPYTHQLTPGLTPKKIVPIAGVARGLYTATNGNLYYVCKNTIYYIDSTFNITALGNLGDNLTTPVGMQDNGNVLVIVNGQANVGWAINLQPNIAGRPLSFQLTSAGTIPPAATCTATLGGTGYNSGDTVGIVFSNTSISSFPVAVGLTLAAGENANSVAAALAEVINATSALTTQNISATVAGAVITISQLGAIGNSTTLVSAISGSETITFSNSGDLTGGSGTSAAAGTYTNVPLTGGSGTGATAASIEVAEGLIIDISLGDTGKDYVVGDVLAATIGGLSGVTIKLSTVGGQVNAFGVIVDPNFLGSVGIGYVDTFLGFNQPGTRNFYTSLSNITFDELTGVPGEPQVGSIIAGGTGGTNGVYNGVALTGGSGDGATADITVAGGIVTKVVLLPTGLGYNAGDVLGADNVNIPSALQYSLVSVNPPAFDPTYIAGKTGYPDLLATIIAVHREWWLIGSFESTEVWYDAGGVNFPFQIMPGVFIQHGCIAPYSVETHDLVTFWLGVDNAGLGTVFLGSGYAAKRISTFAIEKFITAFIAAGNMISDAIGMVYKQQDHIFYVLTFPTADTTLVYDLTEGLWHQRGWTDPETGNLHRIRANCMALAYTVNVCADWENGNIYTLDLANFTDNGGPIVRQRSFPHLLNDGKRFETDAITLDMDCGNGLPSDPTYVPQLTLEVSYDRGKNFQKLPMQSMGKQGQSLVQMIWRRATGLVRDAVFRVTWSEPVFTALQGAWLDITKSET